MMICLTASSILLRKDAHNIPQCFSFLLFTLLERIQNNPEHLMRLMRHEKMWQALTSVANECSAALRLQLALMTFTSCPHVPHNGFAAWNRVSRWFKMFQAKSLQWCQQWERVRAASAGKHWQTMANQCHPVSCAASAWFSLCSWRMLKEKRGEAMARYGKTWQDQLAQQLYATSFVDPILLKLFCFSKSINGYIGRRLETAAQISTYQPLSFQVGQHSALLTINA